MLPVVLASDLESGFAAKWQQQFVAPGRRRAEGIWRRTQEEATRDKSGWTGPGDARRRMIHFLDQYDMKPNKQGKLDFVIDGIYLWLSTTLPEEECKAYEDKVTDALHTHNWQATSSDEFRKDDLTLTITRHTEHHEDVRAGRKLPANYRTIEYRLISDGMSLDERIIDSPWNILNSGIRKQGTRVENPRILEDLSKLQAFLPMQVEIGGGASIELGIPPLNHLHTVYQVTRMEDGHFVFGDEDHIMTDIIADPIAFYKKAGTAYKTCILAQPNIFYRLLRRLFDEGWAIGDIITNNFDGLTALVGLKDKFVRRYDEPKHYPKIDFDPRARSLLVVGNHADRREVQKQARQRGMQIIYVDPEMYFNYFGERIDYPIENVQEEDLLIRMEAVAFAKRMNAILDHASH